MSRLTMNAELGESLKTASEVVELTDEAGRVLGIYTPIRKHVPPLGFQFPLSDEELDRRSRVRTGRSLDEILVDLKN